MCHKSMYLKYINKQRKQTKKNHPKTNKQTNPQHNKTNEQPDSKIATFFFISQFQCVLFCLVIFVILCYFVCFYKLKILKHVPQKIDFWWKHTFKLNISSWLLWVSFNIDTIKLEIVIFGITGFPERSLYITEN